uniref:EAL domain-containing protein n=1 Tax=Salmonella enterica TaxID=28901 RepID=UPI003296D2E9
SFKEDMHRLRDALPPQHFHIVLEITERDMLQQYEAAKLFEWLHSARFEIAIDHFGTAHSGVIYLERFTLDY